MKKDEKWYMAFISYILIAVGVFAMAVAINYFFSPNTIAPGGVTGFAVVVEELIGIEIYLINLIINVPLFIFGAKALGKVTAIKTLYATFLLSFFLKILPPIVLTHDMLLSSIFGGVLAGAGLGLVFKFGGTTGGTDLAGAMINDKYPHFSVAGSMMMIDLLVVAFAGIVGKNIEISLYSVIAMFTTVKVIDLVLEGVGYVKAFYIITNMPDEIGDKLMLDLNRGVTSLQGKGMYTKENKEVLLCVVSRSQFSQVKEVVKSIDPNAFVMVTEMSEVLGEGFGE